MYKKAITICMAVTASAALAVSASASASSPLLTNAAGTPVPVSTNLRATNMGITKFIFPGMLFECSNDVLTGKLTANPNNGSPVEATIETASFKGVAEEDCATGFGLRRVTTSLSSGRGVPYCLRALAEDKLQIRGGACNEAARGIELGLDIFGGECKYERAAGKPIEGTYNTNADLAIEIKAGAKSEFIPIGGGICSSPVEIEVKFGFTEDPSGTLTMD
jgi:hypothetical protein